MYSGFDDGVVVFPTIGRVSVVVDNNAIYISQAGLLDDTIEQVEVPRLAVVALFSAILVSLDDGELDSIRAVVDGHKAARK